jgi:hypothetical protein
MPRDAIGVDHTNPTAAPERDADNTFDRLTRAREDADTPDDATAAAAWRQVARLSSRLHTEAAALARALDRSAVDQRELVAGSLLRCPDRDERRRREG